MSTERFLKVTPKVYTLSGWIKLEKNTNLTNCGNLVSSRCSIDFVSIGMSDQNGL